MKHRKLFISHECASILGSVGENIRKARKRRKLSQIRLAEKASVNRVTVIQAEKGDPGLKLAELFNVLRVLDLHEDLLKVALEDPLGQRFEELEIHNIP